MFCFFTDKKSSPDCSPTQSPFVKTRNSKDISNGNTSANKTKADATVPDGIAPIARTEEMSDDLSEETLVNGESCETTNNSAGKKNYVK